MQFPIQIELRRSRLLAFLTVALHVLAIACLWLLPWPVLARGVLVLIVALSAWHSLRPSPVAGLRLGERGELWILRSGSEPAAAAVQPDSAVFSWLVVLRVRGERDGRLRSLVLLPDSMSAEQFRLLRLWLRWLASPSGGQSVDGV